MKNFNLSISYEDGWLYIVNECGSGAKYRVNNPNQVAFAAQRYIENYCSEWEEGAEDEDYY